MPPPSMYPQPPLPQQPPLLQQSRPIAAERAASARPHTLLLVGIAMLTFAIVLLASRSHSGSPLPTSSLPNSPSHSSEETRETPASSPDISVPSALPDNQVPATPNPQTAITPGTSGDPLEQAARRAVSREAPNIGLPPPPAVSPDGKVHLRSGGTITADEWNAARNKLKDSPLLKEPPAAPPF